MIKFLIFLLLLPFKIMFYALLLCITVFGVPVLFILLALRWVFHFITG